MVNISSSMQVKARGRKITCTKTRHSGDTHNLVLDLDCIMKVAWEPGCEYLQETQQVCVSQDMATWHKNLASWNSKNEYWDEVYLQELPMIAEAGKRLYFEESAAD